MRVGVWGLIQPGKGGRGCTGNIPIQGYSRVLHGLFREYCQVHG